MKYNFEKFLKQLNSIGLQITKKVSDMSASVTMINSDTDIKIFIDENKSYKDFPSKVEFM